ncbi:hypothetical protein [Nocardia sp. NPDC057440]|uniref:hypothetical protein n=1 Tax=Nocardia sp. NPDC057440 TaxID=3346134 RepID=UPI00366F0605
MNISNSDQHRIGRSPRPEEELLSQLDAFITGMRGEEPYVLGFPGNLEFSFSRLGGLLDVLINNVGDPGSADKSDINAKAMERAVVDFMARLANGSPDRTYGYVTSGGSEANQFGLDRGCTLLPDARVYCSQAAHYSIRKNARLMRKELVVIGCDAQDRMDVAGVGARMPSRRR